MDERTERNPSDEMLQTNQGQQEWKLWPVGHQVGLNHRYEIKRHLNSGGFGAAYQAWDRERNCNVVIKAIKPIDNPRYDLERHKHDFLNEAMRLAKLESLNSDCLVKEVWQLLDERNWPCIVK